MRRYLRDHEKLIKSKMETADSAKDLRALKKYHLTRIGFMQHERLIHLLVTIAFGFLMFLILFGSILSGISDTGTVILLIFILLTYYIIHYYILENGVQRWYVLTDEMDRRLKENKKKDREE